MIAEHALRDQHRARIAADDIARAHAARRQGAFDRLGDLLGRYPSGCGVGQRLVHRRRYPSVVLLQLRRDRHLVGLAATLVPDRRCHRAGLDQSHLHLGAVELDPQGIGEGLDRVLGGGVGGGEGHRHPSTNRGDEHDPPLRRAQRRQHRLGDRNLAEHVDVELTLQILSLDQLQRATDPNARVVDQRVQAAARRARHLMHHPLGGLGDLSRVGHLERDRHHGARLGLQREALARGRIAHAGEHRPSPVGEAQSGRTADTRRGACDEC
jgi:hypothetical protein